MRQFHAYERPEPFRASAVRLTRLYIDAELAPGSVVELPPETASHVARVLRARVGDQLILFNGDGREFTAAIEAIRGSRVSASIDSALAVDRESPFAVTLVQCVPRGDRMDFVVQKATELGVARIVPVLSQRGVVRLDARQAESKSIHWRAVAASACEQCGRNRLPVIQTVQPLLNYLGELTSNHARRWVLEPESAASAGRSLQPADHGRADPMGAAEIAVGPEGGFAAEELEAFRIAGFAQVGLGPRVLRTETAAIAALVWMQVHFGDL
ncbi:MAG: 16S rRNA (uracil(1498)-N(3))-methyltransferase [Pseudomonadota bacterium]|nr:16S rRNA (uracil(1498)-N(3))-methyltransferase [Pseudomonadota bacterium]